MTLRGKQQCREMQNNPKAAGTRSKGKALSLSLENGSPVFPYLIGYMDVSKNSSQNIGIS